MSIIEVKSISKKYTLVHQDEKYLTLRDKIAGVISHPVKTISEIRKQKQEEFWALKDISFNVEQGEVIGIIGANGAGKSTLLKILSQITPPTSGEIKIKGKVASLLEVGTGFHPELTGRENIFLNGAILGMAKQEIEKKFNEIVEFSGIEKFLDTPVKRYSSGMHVRLAFSVAAHMEPDILLIDEVLAVGDAEFQKKCLGKMDEVTKKSGRTILFVSHNMGAVQEICERCILLKSGVKEAEGETKTILKQYLEQSAENREVMLKNRLDRKGKGEIRLVDVAISNSEGSQNLKSGDRLIIKIEYESKFTQTVEDARCTIVIYNFLNRPIVRFDSQLTNKTIQSLKPCGEITCETDRLNLGGGLYYINIALHQKGELQDHIINAISFQVGKNRSLYDFTNDKNMETDIIYIAHSFVNN